ncbi:MAG: hypothetical protein DLM72_12315 [Candidatus Nitrosopolaris wilkensis]|nr:MAG: hypothetical protein DLM72_12315 [Candidatus Nitrosopolaris wilkensis]
MGTPPNRPTQRPDIDTSDALIDYVGGWFYDKNCFRKHSCLDACTMPGVVVAHTIEYKQGFLEGENQGKGGGTPDEDVAIHVYQASDF